MVFGLFGLSFLGVGFVGLVESCKPFARVPFWFWWCSDIPRLARDFTVMLLAFWMPVPLASVILCCLQVDRQPSDKSRRKKGNKSIWILRRCIAQEGWIWVPPTPRHVIPCYFNIENPQGRQWRATQGDWNKEDGKRLSSWCWSRSRVTSQYCPLSSPTVLYVNGEPIATFTRAMLLGVVLNLFASFMSLKYWLFVSLIWIVFMASICRWDVEIQKPLFVWLRP